MDAVYQKMSEHHLVECRFFVWLRKHEYGANESGPGNRGRCALGSGYWRTRWRCCRGRHRRNGRMGIGARPPIDTLR